MYILALETSTETGSCALWHDGVVSERVCPAGRPHSETLLPLIRELLAESGIAMVELDAIAFGVGPGAFTGLRVACGAAQGLAVAANLPLVPVTSLETMAEAIGGKQVIALLDARMGEIYAGCYQGSEAGWNLCGEIGVMAPDHLLLPENPAYWRAGGNALRAYPELTDRLVAAGLACHPDALPMAGVMAGLAAVRVRLGETIDPEHAVPLYIRDKVAKTVAERLLAGGRA